MCNDSDDAGAMVRFCQTAREPDLRPLSANPAAAAEPAAARADRQAGFTLLEILVVIVILGLLIGLVAPAVLRQLGGARVSIAHQSIERLASILDMYKLDTGSYPTTEQGIRALVAKPADTENWNGPYTTGNQIPVDPWNHPYIYRNPSSRSGHAYDLCSRGPNATTDDTSQSGLICNP
jgi:general secretion pathway protein G